MRLTALVIAFLGGSALRAESPATQPEFSTRPLPGVLAYADAEGIPTGGIDGPTPGTEPLASSERAVILLTLKERSRTRQWLVTFRPESLGADEGARLARPDGVIHTSTGLTARIPFRPQAVRVELRGPFESNGGEAVSVHQGRSIVNWHDLVNGMADYCQSASVLGPRFSAVKDPSQVIYTWGSDPPSAEYVAKSRRSLEGIGLTEQQERESFGVYFSLVSFFETAIEIPACRSILEQVVDMPSLWSIAVHFGVNPGFNYWWPDVTRVPPHDGLDLHQLHVLVTLNGKLGVKARLTVARPAPPLDLTAGIYAIALDHPTDPSRHIYLRVLSARRGS